MNTPIFSLDGTVTEVDLMDGGGMDDGAASADLQVSLASLPASAFRSPQPSMIFRDRAGEAEARQREQHRIEMILHPELTKARDLVEKRELEVQQWANVCAVQRTEVRRLESLVQRASASLMHEDSEPGARKERLAAARERYAESREEFSAAREELEMARQKVAAFEVTA